MTAQMTVRELSGHGQPQVTLCVNAANAGTNSDYIYRVKTRLCFCLQVDISQGIPHLCTGCSRGPLEGMTSDVVLVYTLMIARDVGGV